MILVNFVLMFVTGLTYPVIPLYLSELENVGVIGAGLILSISSSISMLSNIVFGYLSDVFGSRKLFVSIGLGIASLCYATQHYLENVFIQIILYIMANTSHALAFVSSIATVSTSSNLSFSMDLFNLAGSHLR